MRAGTVVPATALVAASITDLVRRSMWAGTVVPATAETMLQAAYGLRDRSMRAGTVVPATVAFEARIVSKIARAQ